MHICCCWLSLCIAYLRVGLDCARFIWFAATWVVGSPVGGFGCVVSF